MRNRTYLCGVRQLLISRRSPYLSDTSFPGTFSQDISINSSVDYQINITANNGDSGAFNGTYHICDYIEKMHQPPDSDNPEKNCPPSRGPVFINFAVWFADFLVAPVSFAHHATNWQARVVTCDRVNGVSNSMPRRQAETGFIAYRPYLICSVHLGMMGRNVCAMTR